MADKGILLAEGLYLIEGLHTHKTENGRLSRAALVNVSRRAIRIPKGKALGRAKNRTTGVKVFAAAAADTEGKQAGPRMPNDTKSRRRRFGSMSRASRAWTSVSVHGCCRSCSSTAGTSAPIWRRPVRRTWSR